MAREMSYLKRMRSGQPPHQIVTLGNGSDSFDIAVVLLSTDLMLDINEQVEARYPSKLACSDGEEKVEVKNEKDSPRNRMMYYNKLLCYHAMRDPDNIYEKVSDSPDEVGELLDDEDIKRICEQYNKLVINKAPKLDVLTEEELNELKKYLEVTPSKDLSTVLLIHLRYCHQTLVSEKCLTNNGSGSL